MYEYGGAVGIITMEDIGEEIVGSIDEEYNKGEKLYKKTAPMDGRAADMNTVR